MKMILHSSAALILGAGVVSSALAQTPATSGLELEEIIVTAEKREVDLQKTPISVTAVTGAELLTKGISTLDKALEETPSVKISISPQGGSGAGVFIRGVGSNFIDPDRAAQPAVAINVDGVTNSTPAAVISSMFDVERVEVLRGPQGTLYGSSAEGGVVNIVLANPKPVFELKGRAQVGNYNAREVEGMINVPLIQDKLAVRFTASSSKHDGYVRGVGVWKTPYSCAVAEAAPVSDADACNSAGEKNAFYADNYGASSTTVYRAKVKADPIDWLSVVGTYERTKIDANDTRRVANEDFYAGREFYSNLTSPYDISSNHIVYINTNLKQIYKLDVTMGLGSFATLVLRPARQTEDPTATAANVPSIGSKQNTYEALLSSMPSSPFSWTAGAYYRDLSQDVTLNSDSTVVALVDDGRLAPYAKGRPFKEWNAFGQITYPITKDFRVTGGARYSSTKSTFVYELYNTPGVAEGATTPLTSMIDHGTFSASDTDKTVTWKVGAEYDVAAQSLLYATVSTGYKAGGFGFQDTGVPVYAPSDIVLQTYKPEKSSTFEIGSKNRFFGDRLQVNGAVFYNIWKDMQLKNSLSCSVAYPNCDGSVMSQTTQSVMNADISKQYGLELETTWVATPSDRINFSLTAMRGTYGEVQERAFGGVVYELKGHRMSNMPDLAGTLGYEHVFLIDNQTRLTSKIDEQYSTWYYNTQEYWLSNVRVPGYGKTDVALTLSRKDWSLNMYVRNLTNRIQNQFAHPQGVSPSEPRIFGVGVSVSL